MYTTTYDDVDVVDDCVVWVCVVCNVVRTNSPGASLSRCVVDVAYQRISKHTVTKLKQIRKAVNLNNLNNLKTS